MELVFTGEFPPMRGGIGNFIYSRCQSPPKDGLRILAPDIGTPKPWDRSSGLNIRRFRYQHGISFSLRGRQPWWSLNALTKELRSQEYRLVSSSTALPFGWTATRNKKRFGHRVAIFCHGNDILQPLFSPVARRMFYSAMSNADIYIANSYLTADKLIAQGWDQKRIHVVHPPIDLERFHPGLDGTQVREAWSGRKGAGPIILTVSRLDEPRKGIDTMISLLPKLRSKFPDVIYVVIGEGKNRYPYEKMADELGVSSHVLFPGGVSDIVLPLCYAACDVFVLPAKSIPEIGSYEGFGIVYREAMACGKPVIVSKLAGGREMIQPGENGLLANPNDLEETFQAILSILQNPEVARKMGETAAVTAMEKTDWSCLEDLT